MAEQHFLLYRHSSISYLRFGTGPRPVICFHGYGEGAGSFAFLEKEPGNQYSFYAIDLPFHGRTEWKEGLNFTESDLLAVVENILENEVSPGYGLQSADKRLTLMGFSLGGRVALSLYGLQPGKFEKLILLAPDGLKVNFWYWLSTQTWAGNRIFAFTMKHPAWFFGLLKLLNRLGTVNASIFKFVNYYIGDQKVRNLLYDRWTGLRKLKPGLAGIKAAIREQHTVVRLVYGKHDRIIRSSVGERFKKGIENQCSLSVIDSGHQVLHEKHGAEIRKALLH